MANATASTPQPSYSPGEVAQHNTASDLWVIIDQDVYDLSDFMDEHPGGQKGMRESSPHYSRRHFDLLSLLVLLGVAGKDATKKFRKYHRDSILNRYKERLQMGVLCSESRSRGIFAWLRKK